MFSPAGIFSGCSTHNGKNITFAVVLGHQAAEQSPTVFGCHSRRDIIFCPPRLHGDVPCKASFLSMPPRLPRGSCQHRPHPISGTQTAQVVLPQPLQVRGVGFYVHYLFHVSPFRSAARMRLLLIPHS